MLAFLDATIKLTFSTTSY